MFHIRPSIKGGRVGWVPCFLSLMHLLIITALKRRADSPVDSLRGRLLALSLILAHRRRKEREDIAPHSSMAAASARTIFSSYTLTITKKRGKIVLLLSLPGCSLGTCPTTLYLRQRKKDPNTSCRGGSTRWTCLSAGQTEYGKRRSFSGCFRDSCIRS